MILTENRRIALNTLVTYSRSLVALCFGLWTSRWVLRALGKNDYGLFGVVGGLIAFVILLNNVMANSVGRFYAYAIGEIRNMSPTDGRDHVRRWFNTAFSIHGLLPIFLISLGYPIGVYAMHNWLVIPTSRMDTCLWVFRLSLIGAFISMISVPYTAMYRARQMIAELSFWGMAQTILMFFAAYALLYLNGDKMFLYALMATSISCAILFAQMIRAWFKFPECRLQHKYLTDTQRLKPLIGFGLWELLSCFGDICHRQGTAFIINKRFDSGVNAAYGISMQVSLHTSSLSQALLGALSPAVTSYAGAGEKERMIGLGIRSSKFSAFLVSLFAIPLIIEMDEVLKLWLISPPEWTATLCRAILIALISQKLGWGNHMLVMASGKVAGLECCMATISLLTLPVIWYLVNGKVGVAGIGYAFIISYSMLSLIRAWFSWIQVGLSPARWIREAVIPAMSTLCIMFIAGITIMQLMEQGFFRLMMTSAVCSIAAMFAGWLILLTDGERSHLITASKRILTKVRHK